MKILVTGNAGSGKSTISKHVADILRLPLYSLDGIVWQAGWTKTPQEEQERKIQEIILAEHWVIDGVSLQAQEAADVIIFLDVSRRVCFWQAAKRNRKYLFSSRPELPERCPEILIIPTLLKIIWRFPKKVRPKILAEKNMRSTDDFVHLSSRSEQSDFLVNGLPKLKRPL